jgi:hypothetical protein
MDMACRHFAATGEQRLQGRYQPGKGEGGLGGRAVEDLQATRSSMTRKR